MKRIGYIYEKIYTIENLTEAHRNAKKGKGHYKEVQFVEANLDACLFYIQFILKNGYYKVGKYRTQTITDKGKKRKLMKLPYFPDRIIQWAIMLQIEDYFIHNLCYFTCASVKCRGIKRAYNLTKRYLKDDPEGTKYCLKIDISKFYDNINHKILKQLLVKKFKDKQLLQLLYAYIDSIPGEKGIPIGAYLSQYFANFYLSYFDHYLKEQLHIKYIVRYMDDIIILTNNKENLHKWRMEIENYLNNYLDLQLKSNYSVFPVDKRSIDFVGYKFFHNKILLRKRTAKTIINSMRKVLRKRYIKYHDYCMIYSFYGFTRYYGNCFHFYSKYIYPMLRLAYDFHYMYFRKGPNFRQLETQEIILLNKIKPDFIYNYI